MPEQTLRVIFEDWILNKLNNIHLNIYYKYGEESDWKKLLYIIPEHIINGSVWIMWKFGIIKRIR